MGIPCFVDLHEVEGSGILGFRNMDNSMLWDSFPGFSEIRMGKHGQLKDQQLVRRELHLRWRPRFASGSQ